MLIYNFQKEFLGIDAKDLQELGYHDLSSLRSEVTDFADLFVKTPGFIHNFQHVHWIDFIDCADDGEIQKVIINANGKNFTANLSISYAYLTDNPIEKAYLIHLHNLRVLSDGEVERIHDDILQRPTPTVAPVSHEPAPSYAQPEPETPTVTTPEQTQDIFTPTEILQETLKVEIPQEQETTTSFDTPAIKDVYDTSDVKLDVDMGEETLSIEEVQETQTTATTKKTHTIHKKEQFDNGYIYNPEVASKELGLPLDLIEEFIQDFIAQAGDFKPELYASLNDGDIDNVKTLSHKLKGVAANLRIEDAFEVLAIINTTSDVEVIKTNLELFYKIISKLAGEEIDEVVEVVDEESEEVVQNEETVQIEESPLQEINTNMPETDDLLDLNFKDEDEIALVSNDLTIDENTEDQKETEAEEEDFSLTFKDDTPIVNIGQESIQEALIPEEEKEEKIVAQPQVEEPTIEINYSKEKIANEIGLDIASFNELFHDYISEANLLLQEMKDAAQEGDFDLLKSEIMKLKGMSENMRVNSFNDELNTLINTTDKEEAIKYIEKVSTIIKQLSKEGVQ